MLSGRNFSSDHPQRRARREADERQDAPKAPRVQAGRGAIRNIAAPAPTRPACGSRRPARSGGSADGPGPQFENRKTLNASLWELLTRGWRIGPLEVGPAIVWVTLLSEGALLFVAAQTGFLDGPRTLSAMSADEWVPKRFKNLSERLVTQNGVLSMGIAAAAVLYYTRGAVALLVVMYSINVFLTFTLSQLGMARHWLQVRKESTH